MSTKKNNSLVEIIKQTILVCTRIGSVIIVGDLLSNLLFAYIKPITKQADRIKEGYIEICKYVDLNQNRLYDAFELQTLQYKGIQIKKLGKEISKEELEHIFGKSPSFRGYTRIEF